MNIVENRPEHTCTDTPPSNCRLLQVHKTDSPADSFDGHSKCILSNDTSDNSIYIFKW